MCAAFPLIAEKSVRRGIEKARQGGLLGAACDVQP
jgi:hypothetical protein